MGQTKNKIPEFVPRVKLKVNAWIHVRKLTNIMFLTYATLRYVDQVVLMPEISQTATIGHVTK